MTLDGAARIASFVKRAGSALAALSLAFSAAAPALLAICCKPAKKCCLKSGQPEERTVGRELADCCRAEATATKNAAPSVATSDVKPSAMAVAPAVVMVAAVLPAEPHPG